MLVGLFDRRFRCRRGLGCRNRLIAALTRGTVVVEAAARSGALNTANWAQRLNRFVMGVPGPVTSACSVGIHHLINRGDYRRAVYAEVQPGVDLVRIDDGRIVEVRLFSGDQVGEDAFWGAAQ